MSIPTKPLAWAVEAAKELHPHYGRGTIRLVAAIIAKHAPRPMRLQWKTDNDGATFYADTPFGRYKVGKSWWTFNDGSDHNFDGHDENKTAAEAHFDERVAKCMEPPYAG